MVRFSSTLIGEGGLNVNVPSFSFEKYACARVAAAAGSSGLLFEGGWVFTGAGRDAPALGGARPLAGLGDRGIEATGAGGIAAAAGGRSTTSFPSGGSPFGLGGGGGLGRASGFGGGGAGGTLSGG